MVHSVVEYIPFVGTIYSVERSVLALAESKSKLFWASVANAIECTVRDVILVSEKQGVLRRWKMSMQLGWGACRQSEKAHKRHQEAMSIGHVHAQRVTAQDNRL